MKREYDLPTELTSLTADFLENALHEIGVVSDAQLEAHLKSRLAELDSRDLSDSDRLHLQEILRGGEVQLPNFVVLCSPSGGGVLPSGSQTAEAADGREERSTGHCRVCCRNMSARSCCEREKRRREMKREEVDVSGVLSMCDIDFQFFVSSGFC